MLPRTMSLRATWSQLLPPVLYVPNPRQSGIPLATGRKERWPGLPGTDLSMTQVIRHVSVSLAHGKILTDG